VCWRSWRRWFRHWHRRHQHIGFILDLLRQVAAAGDQVQEVV
jgi:hypothetical protein